MKYEVDKYIAQFPKKTQEKLEQIRKVIIETAPEATETISYQMPTFKLNGNLVHYAGYEKHIGFYPTPSAILKFKHEISEYKNAKGSVQFPLDKPLPIELIKRMVEFRIGESLQKKIDLGTNKTID